MIFSYLMTDAWQCLQDIKQSGNTMASASASHIMTMAQTVLDWGLQGLEGLQFQSYKGSYQHSL